MRRPFKTTVAGLMGAGFVSALLWLSLAFGDGVPVDTRDVYQNVFDDAKIKTYLLRRIAKAQFESDPKFEIPDTAPAKYAGLYLHTEDSDELEQLFDTIAKRIQLRLIE